MSRIFLTGAAGFIGYHTARAFCARGDAVVGFDNLNDYYDPALKQARLELLADQHNFRFIRGGLEDALALKQAFELARPDAVVHLAAQAGVRYSLQNPQAYVSSNLIGFSNLLELCRQSEQLGHLVFASSSSVYGANTRLPFSTADRTDHPISLYAATKKANEAVAHAYSHLFGIPTTGLRFFTVYGPWGRPDMAYFSFTRSILAGKPIKVFNHGNLQRDFTYIDDVVEGILRSTDRPPTVAIGEQTDYKSNARYKLYNIGNHNPVALMDFIGILERECGRKAVLDMQSMQAGDVYATYADVAELMQDVGFAPSTPIEVGLKRFVAWYREYDKA